MRPATRNWSPPSGVSTMISACCGDTPVSGSAVGAVRDQHQVALAAVAADPAAHLAHLRLGGFVPAEQVARAAVQVVASRPNARRAVSWQRHHGLDRISPIGALRARSASPSRCASARPARDRLRWRAAVLEPEARRVADARRGGRVADEQHLPAALHQLPCALVGARALRQQQHDQRNRQTPRRRWRSPRRSRSRLRAACSAAPARRPWRRAAARRTPPRSWPRTDRPAAARTRAAPSAADAARA